MPVLKGLSSVYRHWEIARLIRAGLDTCISPRLLINTKSLFCNQAVHEYAQLSGLSPTE
jgi:hypothetical protein